MTPTDTIGDAVRLFHADCLDVLRHLPAGSVDAVITDPPYGMAWDTDSKRFSGGKRKAGDGRNDWGPVRNDGGPFDPSPWLQFPRVVLWGANHYCARLPVGTWLVWVKRFPELYGSFLSDAEVGWMKGGHGVYCHEEQFPPPSRMAENRGEVAHPNQKPIRLLRWCLERAKVRAGMTVLDPFMGSGTTGIAALQMGCRFVGVELDPGHYETARKRLSHAAGEGTLFAPPKQLTFGGEA